MKETDDKFEEVQNEGDAATEKENATEWKVLPAKCLVVVTIQCISILVLDSEGFTSLARNNN